MWQASNLLSHWFSRLVISLFGFCGLNPELEATGSDAELAKGFFRMNRLAYPLSIINTSYEEIVLTTQETQQGKGKIIGFP